MDEALAKIRPHTSSSLPHQKTPATLLLAIETTLREQNADNNPTAYFAALLTTLDSTIQKKDVSLNDGDILPAELYLLALVLPFVSAPVIRLNLNTLLSLTTPLFPDLIRHAPSLRSQLSLYHTIFVSLDRAQLDAQGIRQSFSTILNLSIDPRPKVRKKAADVIKDVLTNPPTPLAQHPYAIKVGEWVLVALTEVSSGPLVKSKGSKFASSNGADSALHILSLLRPLLGQLPPSLLPSLTSQLLLLPRLGNSYLSQSAYSILSDVFALPVEDTSVDVSNQMSDVLKVVLSSPPSKSDATLSPVWVQVLGDAMKAFRTADPEACANNLPKVWKAIWNFLDSGNTETRKAVAKACDSLCHCISPVALSTSIADNEGSSNIHKIISQVTKAVDSLQYAHAIPELLSIISSLITSLGFRNGGRSSPTAAEILILPLIQHVGELRTQKGFEHKESVDGCLTTAMTVIGPEVLLTILPLNLEPSKRQEGLEPRAFLLPLLSNPHPSPLSHFISYFVPLSERMFDLQQKAEVEGRQSEAKVWSVLVGQVWSGLVGYCYGTVNLDQDLTPAFSQLLSQLLYTQPELRVAILKALKVMVDSNIVLASSPVGSISPTLTKHEAAKNVAFLRTQAESWLAVFFNVFSSVGRDSRGVVGEVISSWASIAGEEEINKAYVKVIQLFKTSLQTSQSAQVHHGKEETENMTAISQDILLLLLPHMSSANAQSLFELCLSPEILGGKDNAVQKRGYKILTKIVEAGKITVEADKVLMKLDELTDGLVPSAKKDRFNLMTLLIPSLPPSSMHTLLSLIPEVVLGTKEPSEKARGAAFDVIVAMGRKMSKGGVVKRNLVDGMDEDSAGDAAANIEEFMTMIAGGLAGASPHMISATVTAISRLVFEFKDEISPTMHSEIFSTLLVFLSSANREIVKSILGFIKLSIHTLPTDIIHPHLKDLVPALLKWSHDHKNHFKVKVRHIFERMLRRFSWDEVYRWAGEEEAGKVLINIRKRKERAKRKRAARTDTDEEAELPTGKAVAGDAFEDILYGSESELEDSDDDQNTGHEPSSKNKPADRGARLRADDDEPMDLLQGAASHIIGQTSKRRKPGQEAAHFKIDESSGKIILDDREESEEDHPAEVSADVVGTAYRESMTSVDGFTRGPDGRVKFNKDTKKRRRENDDIEDIEMADAETKPKQKSKRGTDAKLGREFKAKRAGGDIKKGDVDPYAYLSLSQAAKKGRRGQGVGITGKR